MYEPESDVSRPLGYQGHASGRGPSAREDAGVGRFDVFSSPLPTGGREGGGGSSRIGSVAGVVSRVDLFPHARPAGGRGNGAGSEQERRRTIYSKMEMP
jgi:hypothetical protein